MLTEILNKIKGRSLVAEVIPKITTKPPAAEYDAMLATVTNLCVAVGLKKMLTDRHFSICDLDTLLAAANVRIDGDVRRALACVHCVNWNDMPRELRQEIYRILGETFGATQ